MCRSKNDPRGHYRCTSDMRAAGRAAAGRLNAAASGKSGQSVGDQVRAIDTAMASVVMHAARLQARRGTIGERLRAARDAGEPTGKIEAELAAMKADAADLAAAQTEAEAARAAAVPVDPTAAGFRVPKIPTGSGKDPAVRAELRQVEAQLAPLADTARATVSAREDRARALREEHPEHAAVDAAFDDYGRLDRDERAALNTRAAAIQADVDREVQNTPEGVAASAAERALRDERARLEGPIRAKANAAAVAAAHPLSAANAPRLRATVSNALRGDGNAETVDRATAEMSRQAAQAEALLRSRGMSTKTAAGAAFAYDDLDLGQVTLIRRSSGWGLGAIDKSAWAGSAFVSIPGWGEISTLDAGGATVHRS